MIKVKAVTMRRDAISQFLLMATPPSEGHNLGQLAYESVYYQSLKQMVPEVKDLAILSTLSITMAVSIDKQARKARPGLEKRVAMAVRLINPHAKNLFLVDDDINPHDVQEVLWRFSVSFQPAKDITVIPDVPGIYLDPSETLIGPGYGYSGLSSYGVFDCTEKLPPYDEGFKRGVVLPPREALDRVEQNWTKYGFKE